MKPRLFSRPLARPSAQPSAQYPRLFPLYRTRSPFARQASVVYALLIAFISLYPLTGWRDLGVSPFAFFLAPLPTYRTLFDLGSNVLAYVPLGFLLTLAFYPRVRGVLACVLATCLGLAWSGMMEIGQVYLPARIPSNLDTLLNTGGTLLGALLGSVRAPHILLHGNLARWRLRWLVREASFGLILLLLWYLAQMRPQIYAFGLGDWVRPVLSWLAGWWPEPLDSLAWYNWINLSSDDFVAFESLIVACQVSTAGLLLLSLLRPDAPRQRLLLVGCVLALLTKGLTQRLLLGVDATWNWLTPGTLAGLLMSGLLLIGACNSAPRAVLRLALFMLSISLLLTNCAPDNLYALARIEAWNPGQWFNLHGVVQVLDWAWPALAFVYLLRRLERSTEHTA